MKIEHLRYFLSVANTKSINQAAKELFISHQQLNNIISSLEDEMHITLLDRTNKGVSLTEDGAEFATYAGKILADYSAMQNHFYIKQSVAGKRMQNCHGQCILHVAPSFSVFLSDFVNKFKEVAPNIDLLCIESDARITEEQLIPGHLYLLGYNPTTYVATDAQFFNSILLRQFEAYVYLNRNSDLAKNAVFSLEHCTDIITAALPFVSPTGYNEKNISLISSNIYQHLDSITQNNTVCILPGFLYPKMKSLYPDVIIRPLEEPTFSSCTIVYANSYTLTEADEILITFLKTYLQNQQLFAKQTFL